MKFLIPLLALLFTMAPSTKTQKWGATGHRVVGDVAEHYLNTKARKAVHRILGSESMAIASTWMDEIKSDPKWDYTHDWHWVTIPDGETYAETKKNPNGDVIEAIRRITSELKSGSLPPEKEKIDLKMLIHLVGDIHQPLHVGTGKDRGGNDVRVEWFRSASNLHRVWDSDMINQYGLSYTELSDAVNHPTKAQIKKWQHSTVLDWAKEAIALRKEVYNLPVNHKLSYKYMYYHFGLVEQQLVKGGVRLAGVLNEIYG